MNIQIIAKPISIHEVKALGDDALEYVSLINVRPAQGNTAMEISDTNLRSAMRGIIERLVPDLFS